MAVVRYNGDTDRGRATRSTFKQVTRSMFKQPSRSTFKQIHNNNVTTDEKTRVSKRLRMRKKQKGGTSKERSLGDPPVDYLRKPIEYGNPAQKLLFLKNLGLVPKEGILMPPFVVLRPLQERMISALTQKSKDSAEAAEAVPNFPAIINGSSRHEGHDGGQECSCSNSDIEDLDLELLIYPIDIPEFLEDIEKSHKCRSSKHEPMGHKQKEGAKKNEPEPQTRRKSLRITEQQRKTMSACHLTSEFINNNSMFRGREAFLVDLT